MATIAIGDVHGHADALADVLEQVRQHATPTDTVVFLGDYIDRGPDSRACVDAVLAFRRGARCEVACLLGNHEHWLLRTLDDHTRHSWLLGMEAFETIRSYSTEAAETLRAAASAAGPQLYLAQVALPYAVFFDRLPADHLEFFRSLRPYHRTDDCVCAHGGVSPLGGLVEGQTVQSLVWGEYGFPEAYQGSDLVVYGHRDNATLNESGWPVPTIVGRTIGIDTISHGVLTAVRLPDCAVFQSARRSGSRSADAGET